MTLAPIIPEPGWEEAYADLLDEVAAAVRGSGADLTVECITHRFTPGSKEVLEGWYPATRLEMDPEQRRTKRGRFGSVKHVYADDVMAALRTHVTGLVEERIPDARLLYWT